MGIQKFFNSVAPQYATQKHLGKVEIIEHQNIGKNDKIDKVIWTSADFYYIDDQLSKDLSSFFEKAGSPEVFKKDCDGIVLFERENKKYMFLTELKSKFGTEDLYKAKMQIVSSFLKVNMLLNLSTCYLLKDYIIKGFIVGHPPMPDFLVNLHKGSMLSDRKKEREYELAKRFFIDSKSRELTLYPTDFLCLKGLPLGPLGIFSKITLNYIEVPYGQKSVTIDVNNYL